MSDIPNMAKRERSCTLFKFLVQWGQILKMLRLCGKWSEIVQFNTASHMKISLLYLRCWDILISRGQSLAFTQLYCFRPTLTFDWLKLLQYYLVRMSNYDTTLPVSAIIRAIIVVS